MQSPLEEAVSRIVICGVNEIPATIASHNIGMVFALSGCESPKDYKNLPYTVFPFTGKYGFTHHSVIQQKEHISELNQITQAAIDFLDHSNDKILIHCFAGAHRSPTFAIKLLMQIQGKHPDFSEAIRAVRSIRPETSVSGLIDGIYCLDIPEDIAKEVITQCMQGKQLSQWLKSGYTAEQCAAIFSKQIGESASIQDIINLCERFGYSTQPKGTAPCDASNDRPERTPSSLRTRECP